MLPIWKQPYNPQHAELWLTVKSQNAFKPKPTTEESKNMLLIFILFCYNHQPLEQLLRKKTHTKPSQPTCLLLADITESLCTEPHCVSVYLHLPTGSPQLTLLTTGTEALNAANLSMFKRFCVHPLFFPIGQPVPVSHEHKYCFTIPQGLWQGNVLLISPLC